MPLTTKESDTNIREVLFPIQVEHSALIESAYTSTAMVADTATIALGFKPTAATTTPLSDMTSHYLLTIQKQGSTVRVWKQGVELANFTGTIGTTYAEFLSNVLTAYCGNVHGYYSHLMIAEEALSYLDFWEPSYIVTGLWIPRTLDAIPLHTSLNFADALDLGADSSGNGNSWTITGIQSDDTPTDNATTRDWNEPTVLTSASVADVVLREGNSANVVSGLTPTSNHPGSSWPVTNTTDGNASTAWYTQTSAMPVTWEVNLGTTETIASWDVTIGGGDPNTAPKDYIVETYLDGIWTQVGSVFDAINTTAVTTTHHECDMLTKASRIRFTFTDWWGNTGMGMSIDEICVYDASSIDLPLMENGPDFVLTKNRDGAYAWILTDRERPGLSVYTDSTAAETSTSLILKNTGYSVGQETAINAQGSAMIDLCLKAAAETGFFQTASVDHTTGSATPLTHGFGSTVTFGLVKRTDSGGSWYAFHTALGADRYINLDSINAAVTSSGFWSLNTSTQFEIPAELETGTYVAYLFTDSDVCKAFSYTGNGLTAGPRVDLGGKILSAPFIKNADSSGYWHSFFAPTSPNNPDTKYLLPSEVLAEGTSSGFQRSYTATGLTIEADDPSLNGSGDLHVGLAILESTKYSNAY